MRSSFCVLDLAQKPLGRMCSIAAKLLINSSKTKTVCKLTFINFLETKSNLRLMNKLYWRHTGYPGGIKQKLASTFDRKRLILKVLSNMLPRNKTKPLLLSRVTFTSKDKLSNFQTKLKFISTSA
ncbi:MAG: uL13 family ribosomal protein [Candidatus Hodgkinia cicadicola]